jgi:NTE family protein
MDRRALVLGGGGVTGIAWETGLIAGLAGLDIDLAAADVIIGTSAGSLVGTDIACGQDLEALYQAQPGGTRCQCRLCCPSSPAR